MKRSKIIAFILALVTILTAVSFLPSCGGKGDKEIIPETYEITYMPNGGKASGSTVDSGKYDPVYPMQPTRISDDSFVREGYQPVGYSTSPDAFEGHTNVNEIENFSNLGGICRTDKEGKLTLYVVWAKESPVSDIEFNSITGTVTKYNGTDKEVVIPEKINGKKVTSIAAEAFGGDVERVVIPKYVTSIADGAFAGCADLREVVACEGIASVSDKAFEGCTSLSNIVLNRRSLPKFANSSEGAFCIKYERVKTVVGKKLIFIAGSSTLMGINSVTAAKEFPGYQVINYGTNAGTPTYFYLDVIENYAAEGDIIVYSPEFLMNTTMGSKTITWRLFRANEQCFDIFREVDMTEYTGFWDALSAFMTDPESNAIAASDKQPCSCDSINIYGDLDTVREGTRESAWENVGKAHLNTENVNYVNLNHMNSKLVAKGTTLLFSFAPYDETTLDAGETECRDFENYCKSKLDFPVISSMWNYILPHDSFYDSQWHCNNAGAETRTDLLLRDLKAYLEK